MNFLHMSDLHLGKKVNGFSMEEEQQNVLDQAIELIENREDSQESINAVIIAGDIYDKNVPTVTAVTMFDNFVTELAKLKVAIYAISGNHDSAERLSFGSRLFQLNQVNMVTSYKGEITCAQAEDEYGTINIYMLPYIRPIDVKRVHEVDVDSFERAMQIVLGNTPINTDERNIIIAHQNINGAALSDSEDVYIGGLDGISAELFMDFDYVALGHLHRNQKIKSDSIRYAGSPVKYSFSEANYKKVFNIVHVGAKGHVSVEEQAIIPVHDMRMLRGNFEDIIGGKLDEDKDTLDYVQVTLTDEDEVVNVQSQLRDRYPNLMQVLYDNTRTKNLRSVQEIEIKAEKKPLEYIGEFFDKSNGREMSEHQQDIMNQLIDEIWGGK